MEGQEQKNRRWEENQECENHVLEEMYRIASTRGWTEARLKMQELLETAENMAFMEGYRYAVDLLESGMRPKQ